jgi:hypothetical protein
MRHRNYVKSYSLLLKDRISISKINMKLHVTGKMQVKEGLMWQDESQESRPGV